MNENGYMTFRPTIWNRLGFGHCSAEIDVEESTLHEIFFKLDWRDRLRILVSGSGMVSLRVDVADVTNTASRISVTPPASTDTP